MPGLDTATYKTAVASAFNTLWSAGALDTLKADVAAALDAAATNDDHDPAHFDQTRKTCSDAICAAVHKYVHGADGAKVTALADALATANEAYVKSASITFDLLNVGLQTSTAPGAVTAAPLVPVTYSGMLG